MGFQMVGAFGGAMWLAAGAALGIGAMLARRKLRDWREARLAGEWDPY